MTYEVITYCLVVVITCRKQETFYLVIEMSPTVTVKKGLSAHNLKISVNRYLQALLNEAKYN